MSDLPLYTRNCEIKPGMTVPEGMLRYAAVIEYNGSSFQGFQKQASTPNTVQEKLEKALSFVAAESVTVICAGRTDAGVHACTQVVHFDTTAKRPEKAWVEGGNTQLPSPVRVLHCQPVSFDFHARFSALARVYRYITLIRPVESAVLKGLVTWRKHPLDHESMSQAAQYLVGEQDFSSFRASQCQAKSPMRHLEYLRLRCSGDFIVAEVKANAFLHHMVRNIMGALFEVGRGAKPPEWMEAVLYARDRRQNAATAPAFGLYFVGVDYSAEFAIPSAPSGPLWLPEALLS